MTSKRLLSACAALMLVAAGVRAEDAAPQPADQREDPAFIERCLRLMQRRIEGYGDVASYTLARVWKSDNGYLLDWEQGARAASTVHYCARLHFYDVQQRLLERTTMLCSGLDQGRQTESWLFGNPEVAARACPLSDETLAAMDGAVAPIQPKAARKKAAAGK